jgi:potassium/hydrogen antiporter
MTSTIIIAICSLLLIAYLFDITAPRTRIPSVILLLALGWVVKQLTLFFGFELPDFSDVLPVLGTIGLILIVLEGAMELELNRSKSKLIYKSLFGSLLSLLVLSFLLAFIFYHFGGISFKSALINVVPICVISSAIAIPSARNLSSSMKEYIIYESSFSDILGVLLFNFLAFNESYNSESFLLFGAQLLTIAIISFVATLGLSLLLSKIQHHIKFIPIILLVILIYSIAKEFHLPSLVFILVFGLFLGNLDEFTRFKWLVKFRTQELDKEVLKFKELTIEAAFLIRALFFLLFGYLMETSEILNTETLVWALAIVGCILIIRIIQLKVSRLPLFPLLFIAPRGLITILLFLSIGESQKISMINSSLILQVIVLSALVMMAGLLFFRNEDEKIKNDLNKQEQF